MATVQKIISFTQTKFRNFKNKNNNSQRIRIYVPKSNWEIINDFLSLKTPKNLNTTQNNVKNNTPVK